MCAGAVGGCAGECETDGRAALAHLLLNARTVVGADGRFTKTSRVLG
ncbi:hypothetical protein [Nocardia terpenica]|uniref:Uncharacterized protein n=1 Tax=Nocardia terpenica TaxID=455432 RepID=A0A6G9Z8X5_9NOCA|nr:hypothetical protein [Nocardia terpenica]QIS21626.1 hypothetical protein F6W96_28105 [Nocardia terpenica]